MGTVAIGGLVEANKDAFTWSLGFRVQGSGIRVEGLGLYGLGFWVSGPGSRVKKFWIRI